jgi:hypothetical protein
VANGKQARRGELASWLAWVGLWTVLGWAALGWAVALVLLGVGAVGAGLGAFGVWIVAVLLLMAVVFSDG